LGKPVKAPVVCGVGAVIAKAAAAKCSGRLNIRLLRVGSYLDSALAGAEAGQFVWRESVRQGYPQVRRIRADNAVWKILGRYR